MRRRNKQNESLSLSSVLTGLLSGLMLTVLALFLYAFPFRSYLEPTFYIIFLVAFLVLLSLYFIMIRVEHQRKRQLFLLTSAGFSAFFPFALSTLFYLSYPTLHSAIYEAILQHIPSLLSPVRLSITPKITVALYCLFAAVLGLVAGIVFFVLFHLKTREKDNEYHPPGKKNYYYI